MIVKQQPFVIQIWERGEIIHSAQVNGQRDAIHHIVNFCLLKNSNFDIILKNVTEKSERWYRWNTAHRRLDFQSEHVST